MTTTTTPPTRDFRDLRRGGHHAGTSLAIGRAFCWARDGLARGLLALGVTPNMLTILGALLTGGAAICFALGASQDWSVWTSRQRLPWPVSGALFLFLASACDMLDGAVARLGAKETPLGAVLDSSVDRLSDMALYAGLAAHFAATANMTYVVLSVLALSHASLISYVKARAENMIPDCSVGYWLRGERSAALLIAAGSAHLPAVLWQQAVSPAFTAWRRMKWTYRVVESQAGGRPAPAAGPFTDWRRYVALWRFPRGSLPYDLVTGANIAFILWAPAVWPFFRGASDPLRAVWNRFV